MTVKVAYATALAAGVALVGGGIAVLHHGTQRAKEHASAVRLSVVPRRTLPARAADSDEFKPPGHEIPLPAEPKSDSSAGEFAPRL